MMLDKEVLCSIGTPTLPMPGASRPRHGFSVRHLPTNVLRHLDRSPSIQSRDNPDRWECQEIEGHMAEDLIVLPSWYVVEIHNIPHKSLINKKEELDGSKSFASSFVKLHILAFVSVRVISKTQSPNASAYGPSRTLTIVFVKTLNALSFISKQLRRLSFQEISSVMIISTTFRGTVSLQSSSPLALQRGARSLSSVRNSTANASSTSTRDRWKSRTAATSMNNAWNYTISLKLCSPDHLISNFAADSSAKKLFLPPKLSNLRIRQPFPHLYQRRNKSFE
jgi:hypothetical protein